MMGIFTNPFFSVAGQVERLKNVAATLNAAFNPFSQEKVVANVENKTLKTALETVANHPYLAAGVVAGGITAVAQPAAAAAVVKSAIPATTKGKVAAAVIAPVAIGALTTSEKAREGVLNAPSSLANFGANVGKVIESPSLATIKETFKENPVIATAATLGAAAVVGGGIGLAANTVATALNTRATNANTEPTTATGEIPVSQGGVLKETTMQTDEGTALTPQTTTIKTGKKRYRARQQEKQSIKQNVQVVVNNRAVGVSRKIERYIKGAVYA